MVLPEPGIGKETEIFYGTYGLMELILADQRIMPSVAGFSLGIIHVELLQDGQCLSGLNLPERPDGYPASFPGVILLIQKVSDQGFFG